MKKGILVAMVFLLSFAVVLNPVLANETGTTLSKQSTAAYYLNKAKWLVKGTMMTIAFPFLVTYGMIFDRHHTWIVLNLGFEDLKYRLTHNLEDGKPEGIS